MPSERPLIKTSLLQYTPSKSIKTFLPLEEAGNVNVFRYQPMPPRNAPPPVPVGLVESKGSSMLQSCGSCKPRQAESLKFSLAASVVSPNQNFQPLLKETVRPVAVCALMANAATNVINSRTRFFIV